MPRRAAHACAYPGCPALVHDPGERYCHAHRQQMRRQQDERRGTAAERGYDARWREISDRVLEEHPICERCRRNKATLVHHIIPRDAGGSDDPINLQALCVVCHAQVHAQLGTLFGGHAGGG